MPTTHILTCYAEDCPKGRYKGSVLAWERPHTTPGIHAFLGLATLPRFQTRANPLRVLPREMVDRIARFAHRDTYLASWSAGETPTRRPTAVDIGDLLNASELISGGELSSGVLTSRPIRSGVKYVEVTVNAAWYGTRLAFADAGSVRSRLLRTVNEQPNSIPSEFCDEFLGIQLDTHQSHQADNPQDHPQLCFIKMNGTHLRIKSLGDDSWTWCEDPVVFGVLVDMVRGCVTFRVNGIDGPCVRFPNADWRLGVHLCLSHIPIEPEHDPMQIVVSCATPPVPPSLLEAAANPLTGAEHVAAGSMEYDADVYDSGGEYDFESDDEGESDDHGSSFFHRANVYT